ncbi:MAG: polyphosphate kinase 2 [Dehalococcoidia bacterium]|nr:polyphosphate kinase 2 [Dehalococcoidia bacterium]
MPDPQPPPYERISTKQYERLLHDLQVELVKLQRDFIRDGERTLVILEGRDAAGKDGTIKRITEHLSPRETRVVALGKPSDRDQTTWYFQRYAPHLPAASELVLFNRSWYNRAGVERVMHFCTPDQYEEFMTSVLDFEHMLIRSGIRLFKYYLDISKAEQKERLEDRRKSPLTQWKISSLDEKALDLWDDYSEARNDMLLRTRDPIAPWIVVRANHKKTARVQLIQDLLSRLDYEGKDKSLLKPDPSVVFEFDPVHLENGMLEP